MVAKYTFNALLLDDEENILKSLKRLLRPLGLKIHLFTEGSDALEFMSSNVVDLVISDMRMPNMNGAEFLEKSSVISPDTIRILLTGYADIGSTIDAINKGKIHSYISKPWDDDGLRDVVTKALESKIIFLEKERLEAENEQQRKMLEVLNQELEETVKARTGEIQQTASFLELAYKDLQHSSDELEFLLKFITQQFEGPHSKNTMYIARFVKRIGKKMQLSADYVKQCETAVLLRNLFLVHGPNCDHDLNFYDVKPVNKLMQKTFIIAFSKIDTLGSVAEILENLHEQHDGQGQPRGLSGDEVPVGSRIIAVASMFVKLYEENESLSQTFDVLESDACACLDPAIIVVLKELLASSSQKPQSEVMSESLDAEKPIIYLPVDEVELGMILAKDLKSSGGMLLLGKGMPLTQTTLDRIYDLEKSTGLSVSIAIQS